MSESTLNITFTELEVELGRYLGLRAADIGDWSTNEVLDIAACIKRGYRKFLFPERIVPDEPAHLWSFLRPQAILTIWDDVIEDDAITATSAAFADPTSTLTASAAVFYESMEEKTLTFVTSGNTYVIDEYVSTTSVKVTGDASAETGVITIDSEDTFTLPWDYGGMAGDGKFSYDNAENKITFIEITSDVRIRNLRTSTISTGTPWLVAIVPLKADRTQGQRWEAMFHQPPNDVFTLHYRYSVMPDALVKTTAGYPYGSAHHSETLLESCLAIAESREKDTASTEHAERFARCLLASIDRDRQLAETVQSYGYNGDGSDGRGDNEDARQYPYYRHNDLVTFNGNDGSG